MKKLILLLALAVLLIPSVVLASDVTGATFFGIIRVSNADTATTYVSTNVSIDTQSLIDADFINSSCNNSAIVAGGVDIAFGPAVNATYPWCFWVSAIGDESHDSYTLYAGGPAMDGKIRYFPAAGGMTTADSATLELSDNFTITQRGWIDTTIGSGKYLVDKPNAFRTYVSESVAGSITSFMGIVSDNFTTDTWTDVGAGVGVNVGTGRMEYNVVGGDHRSHFDATSVSDTEWALDYTFTQTTIGASGIFTMGFFSSLANADTFPNDCIMMIIVNDDVAIRRYDGGGIGTSAYVQNLVTTTTYYITLERNTAILATLSVYTDAARTTHFGASPVTLAIPAGIKDLRYIQFSSWDSATDPTAGWFDNLGVPAVTASGVAPGEHIVATTANVTHFWITIDGDTKDTVALDGASVPDTADNWTFVENYSMAYMEYHKITIDGTLQQHIEWEYDTTFSDISGNNHDTVPTFRTTSSDADVSAELVSFSPIEEAQAPTFVLEEARDFWDTGNITATGEFTTTPAPTMPGAAVIDAIAAASATPVQLPYTLIVGFVLISASMTTSWFMMKHGSKNLWLKVIIIVTLMAFAIAVGMFDFWMLIFFLIMAIAIILFSRRRSGA